MSEDSNGRTNIAELGFNMTPYQSKLSDFLSTFPPFLPHETGDAQKKFYRQNYNAFGGKSITSLLPEDLQVSSITVTGLIGKLARNGFGEESIKRMKLLHEMALIRSEEIKQEMKDKKGEILNEDYETTKIDR